MTYRHMMAVARKEFYHILRDPGTLLLVTIGPIFLMLVFTYTLTSEVKDASVAVVDLAQTDMSREIVREIDKSKVTAVTHEVAGEDELTPYFEKNQIVAAIIIPEAFGELSTAQFAGIMAGTESLPQIRTIIDGTEPVSAERVLDEVYQIVEALSRKAFEDVVSGTVFENMVAEFLEPPIYLEEERLYNADLSSILDFYPGLAGIMLSLPAISLAMAFAREAEAGTLEQLVATPINKRALLMGKMMPYLVFGLIDVYVLLVVGRVVYDVPFRGSLIEYSLIAFLFMVANLGVGLLIGSFIRSQQVAMIIAILIFFIPPFFMTGVFFPIDAMPWIVQLEMIEFPATHYVAASHAIQLQGSNLRELWFPTVILLILAVEILEIATFLFRKKIVITFSPSKLLKKGGQS